MNKLNLLIESKIKYFNDTENDNNQFNNDNSNTVLIKLAHLRINEEQNIDYPNCRYLLCKAMQGFANSCESKTRILIPNFFRFIKYLYIYIKNI